MSQAPTILVDGAVTQQQRAEGEHRGLLCGSSVEEPGGC